MVTRETYGTGGELDEERPCEVDFCHGCFGLRDYLSR